MSIGLLLLDDHVAVRAGYRRLLEADARFHVTGESGCADDAYAMLQALERDDRMPQVAIVDIRLGGRTGLDFIEHTSRRFASLRFIVFSMHDSQPAITHALRVGALGFVSKSSEPDELLAAILAVSWGQQYLDGLCRRAMATADESAERLKLLTPREVEVLAQLLRGRPSRRDRHGLVAESQDHRQPRLGGAPQTRGGQRFPAHAATARFRLARRLTLTATRCCR